MSDRYYTLSEVSKIIGRSRATVYRLVRSGSIKTEQHDGHYRVKESDLIDFIQEGVIKPGYSKYPEDKA